MLTKFLFLLIISSLFISVPSIGKPVRASEQAASFISSFESIFGVTNGKRRNHTKGFCFEAKLIPESKKAKKYSVSPLFDKTSRVVGRLSHKGGNNNVKDSKPGEYGMGLSIIAASGAVHNMSMNTLDFFPVATAKAFVELMRAKAQGGDAVKLFKQNNTDLQRFKAHAKAKAQVLTPYEGSTFNSINSFYLVNSQGKKTAARWSFVPAQEQNIVLKPRDDFFLHNMQANLTGQGITWNMLVYLANKNDDINNPAIAWSKQNKHFIAAKLVVKSISREAEGDCDSVNYDPLILSSGFAASADPLLQARSNAYAISFTKRMLEKSAK